MKTCLKQPLKQTQITFKCIFLHFWNGRNLPHVSQFRMMLKLTLISAQCLV